jgi:hypothetical protein
MKMEVNVGDKKIKAAFDHTECKLQSSINPHKNSLSGKDATNKQDIYTKMQDTFSWW